MDVIANINLEIYKYITTTEVIMTEERVAHVKENHPDDYEKFIGYIKESLEDPDYIIEANKPKKFFTRKRKSDILCIRAGVFEVEDFVHVYTPMA